MNKTFLHSNCFNPAVHIDGEVNNEPSLTVPDQSLTIPEILDMYTRGLSIDQLIKPTVGYDDPSWDDIDPTLDPTFDVLSAKIQLDEINANLLSGVPTVESTDASEQSSEQTGDNK